MARILGGGKGTLARHGVGGGLFFPSSLPAGRVGLVSSLCGVVFPSSLRAFPVGIFGGDFGAVCRVALPLAFVGGSFRLCGTFSVSVVVSVGSVALVRSVGLSLLVILSCSWVVYL